MPRSKHWKKRAPFMILFIIGFAVVLSFLVMWLWNKVLVPVTGINTVDFWQAAGLLLLSRILFGGFKGGPWKGGPGKHGGPSRWKEKWKSMSEEEKEQLKAKWKDRCN